MKKILLISLLSITSLYGSTQQTKSPAQTDLKTSGEWIRPSIVDRPYIKDFQHAAHRVISDIRSEKLKRYKKSMAAEATRVAKLTSSMLIPARSSNETIQAERKMREAAIEESQKLKHKYKGFKANSAQLLQAAQNAQAQLEADLLSVRHAHEQLSERAQTQEQEYRVQLERSHMEMLVAQAHIARAEADHKRTAENLITQLSESQNARQTAQQDYQTALERLRMLHATAVQEHQATAAELNTTRSNLQSFQQQLTQLHADKTASEQELSRRLQQIQAERTSLEQKLRIELATAQQAHTTATQNYQTAQQQLQQERTGRATTEQQLNQRLQQLQAVEQQLRAELRDLNSAHTSLGQNLRAQLATAQTAHATATQNFQTAQQQLQQERHALAEAKQEMERRYDYTAALEGRFQSKVAELAAAQAAHSTEKASLTSQLQLANAARARYQTLKNFIIDHYAHHYLRACRGDQRSLHTIGVIANLCNGLDTSKPLPPPGQYNDKAHFTAVFNRQFAS